MSFQEVTVHIEISDDSESHDDDDDEASDSEDKSMDTLERTLEEILPPYQYKQK